MGDKTSRYSCHRSSLQNSFSSVSFVDGVEELAAKHFCISNAPFVIHAEKSHHKHNTGWSAGILRNLWFEDIVHYSNQKWC